MFDSKIRKIDTLRKISSGFFPLFLFIIFERVRDVGNEFGYACCKDRGLGFLDDDCIDELDGERFLAAFFGVILYVSEGDVNEKDIAFLNDFVRSFDNIKGAFLQKDADTKAKRLGHLKILQMLLGKHFGLLVDITQFDTNPKILGNNFVEGVNFLVDTFLVLSGVNEKRTANV